jgi:hypothetical protein
LKVQEEIHRILDGPFRLSRAGFGQELRRIERRTRIDIDGPSYRQSSGAALAKRLGTRSPKADHRDIETPP